MKFTAIAKLAAVAGVVIASTLVQPVSASTPESITLKYTKIMYTFTPVNPELSFGADLRVGSDGVADGSMSLEQVADGQTTRSIIEVESGAVLCRDNQPVVIVSGAEFEQIDGRWVPQGPARAEIRTGRSGGGGGGVIIGDFDIIDAAATHIAFRAAGEITFVADPCR